MRRAKLTVYGAILAGTLAAVVGPVRAGLRLETAPVADPTAAPGWAPYAALGLVAVLAFGWNLVGSLRRRRVPVAVYLAALVSLAGVLLLRLVLAPAPASASLPRFTDFAAAPPGLRTAYAAGRLRFRVEGYGLDHGGRYPDEEAELRPALETDAGPLTSGYWYAGEERPFRLRVLRGAPGPVLDVRPGDLAGTLYYAVSPDRTRYWISALRLDPGDGRTTVPFRTASGRTVVLTNSETARRIIRERRAVESGELLAPFRQAGARGE